MNTLLTSCRILSRVLAVLLAAGLVASPTFAQTETPSASTATASGGQPSEAEMMKMMTEMSKLNENHKILGQLAGNWTYTVKMWMNPDPNAKPTESKGTSSRKAIMDGRFYTTETSGKAPMPGPDGKMKEMEFKGMSIEGYDNAKKKFVSTWIDNMGTGILMSEGTYDPATKTFTYSAEYEMAPGMTSKIREVLKIIDNDHHTFEWYDNTRGAEAKTMEINYTRKK
jgi:hypothetical protein